MIFKAPVSKNVEWDHAVTVGLSEPIDAPRLLCCDQLTSDRPNSLCQTPEQSTQQANPLTVAGWPHSPNAKALDCHQQHRHHGCHTLISQPLHHASCLRMPLAHVVASVSLKSVATYSSRRRVQNDMHTNIQALSGAFEPTHLTAEVHKTIESVTEAVDRRRR